MADYMKDAGPIWEEIIAKHNLKKVPVEELAPWWFLTATLGRPIETVNDTNKVRARALFHCARSSFRKPDLFSDSISLSHCEALSICFAPPHRDRQRHEQDARALSGLRAGTRSVCAQIFWIGARIPYLSRDRCLFLGTGDRSSFHSRESYSLPSWKRWLFSSSFFGTGAPSAFSQDSRFFILLFDCLPLVPFCAGCFRLRSCLLEPSLASLHCFRPVVSPIVLSFK